MPCTHLWGFLPKHPPHVGSPLPRKTVRKNAPVVQLPRDCAECCPHRPCLQILAIDSPWLHAAVFQSNHRC